MTFAHMQAFLDKTRGQITLGEIPPVEGAALAAVGKKVHVALLGRDGETMGQLLERLDTALGKGDGRQKRDPQVLPETTRRR